MKNKKKLKMKIIIDNKNNKFKNISKMTIKFKNYLRTLYFANLRFCKNLMHLKQPAKLEHCQMFILCKSSMKISNLNSSVLF